MELNDSVNLNLELGTLAVLISGLYIHNTGVPAEAIPPSMFIELAEQVSTYLPNWDYSKLTLEKWIEEYLIIAPKELFSESELDEMRSDDIFIERELGNAVLIAGARVNV